MVLFHHWIRGLLNKGFPTAGRKFVFLEQWSNPWSPHQWPGYVYLDSSLESGSRRIKPWLVVLSWGWKTTQLHRHYSKPIEGSPIDQPGFNGKCQSGFWMSNHVSYQTNLLAHHLPWTSIDNQVTPFWGETIWCFAHPTRWAVWPLTRS